jgi:transposase-like protein
VSISETDSGTLFTLLEPQENQDVSPITEQDLRKKKERTKELNNNNESPNSWLEGFETEHASSEGKRKLIDEIESYYRARACPQTKPAKS